MPAVQLEDRFYRADDLYQSYQQVVHGLADLVPDLRTLLCQNRIVPMFGEHAEAWDVWKEGPYRGAAPAAHARGGIVTTSMPAAANTASNAAPIAASSADSCRRGGPR
jgi:hypothetical protein